MISSDSNGSQIGYEQTPDKLDSASCPLDGRNAHPGALGVPIPTCAPFLCAAPNLAARTRPAPLAKEPLDDRDEAGRVTDKLEMTHE